MISTHVYLSLHLPKAIVVCPRSWTTQCRRNFGPSKWLSGIWVRVGKPDLRAGRIWSVHNLIRQGHSSDCLVKSFLVLEVFENVLLFGSFWFVDDNFCFPTNIYKHLQQNMCFPTNLFSHKHPQTTQVRVCTCQDAISKWEEEQAVGHAVSGKSKAYNKRNGC